MEDIKSLCERVIIINHGKKIFDDLLLKLVRERLKNKTVKIVFSEPFTKSLDQFGTVLKRDDQLSVELAIDRDKAVAISGKIISSLPVADITIEEPEAEEVIREMFQEKHLTIDS